MPAWRALPPAAHPWMLASIDREVLWATDMQPLECKTAGLNGAQLWKEGEPEYVQLQPQRRLAVTGEQDADRCAHLLAVAQHPPYRAH